LSLILIYQLLPNFVTSSLRYAIQSNFHVKIILGESNGSKSKLIILKGIGQEHKNTLHIDVMYAF